jgi:hypothetical protein
MSINDICLIVISIGVIVYFIVKIIKYFSNDRDSEHTQEAPQEELRPFRIERSITYTPQVETMPEVDKPEVDKRVIKVYRAGHEYTKEEHDFWSGALSYVIQYATEQDYISAYELLMNVLSSKDNDKYAYDLYGLIDASIYYLYPIRDVGNCREFIIDIGTYGISLLDRYIADVKAHSDCDCVWRFPTQMLILLEKSERLEEAIELCDFLTSRRVIDTGYGDYFIARKAKLVKKLNRQNIK